MNSNWNSSNRCNLWYLVVILWSLVCSRFFLWALIQLNNITFGASVRLHASFFPLRLLRKFQLTFLSSSDMIDFVLSGRIRVKPILLGFNGVLHLFTLTYYRPYVSITFISIGISDGFQIFITHTVTFCAVTWLECLDSISRLFLVFLILLF